MYYDWDETSRLSQATPVAGPVTFTYNADHQRVLKQTTSTTTKYIYDFEKVLQETDGGDATTREYTSTEDLYGNLVSAYGAGASEYFTFDAHGSTDALLNDNQLVDYSYTYRAFGLATATTVGGGQQNNNTFAGKWGYVQDRETDLYFLNERYYDPLMARFVSEDPLGYNGPDENLYRYYSGANILTRT